MRLRRSSLVGRLLVRVLTSPRVLRGSGVTSFEACLQLCHPHPSYLDPGLAAARVADTCPTPDPWLTGLLGFVLGMLAPEPTDRLRVVDFGGSAGTHYRAAVMAWGERFDWTIVETPPLVAAAQARGMVVPRLLSTCSAIATRPDLCLVAGSLQYCADPTVIVGELAALEARAYLLLTTPILEPGQEALLGRYWPNRATVFHHLERPQVGPGLLRQTASPVTFLTRPMLAPLATGRRLLHEVPQGPIYILQELGQSVTCWTFLWG